MPHWPSSIVIVLAAALNAGCAVTYHIRPELLPANSATAMVPQWPVRIGVYVAPSVRARVFAEQLWRVPAGEALAANFRWALAQMFADTVEVVEPPAARAGGDTGLAGTVALTDAVLEDGAAQPNPTIRYELALYSRRGEEIDRWSLRTAIGLWDPRASSLARGTVATDIGHAIRNNTAQLMVDFASHAPLRAWLASEGIPDAAVRPSMAAAPHARAPADRLYVVEDIGSWLYTDAADARSCVGQPLAASAPPFEVVSVDQIRLEFFPWLEPATAPKTAESLQRLFANDAVQAQVRALGARYLMEFHGATTTEWKGAVLCPMGCIGFAWGSRESSFRAYLLDMRSTEAVAQPTVERRGRSYVPAFVLPVPIIAATKSAACNEIAGKLLAAITGAAP